MTETDVIFRKAGGEFMPTTWGELNWKITGDGTPGAEMTFGTCRINPGERNQLHSHPDLRGNPSTSSPATANTSLAMPFTGSKPGDAIRIPRNVRHWARALGTEPLFALIMFSSGTRTAINHEGEGAA